MKLLHKMGRPARPFPVATQTREGEPYRIYNPRLGAIDLLREHLADGRAGLDCYDDTVFVVTAGAHEIVWVRRCLDLTGIRGIETPQADGSLRMRAFLEPDVRLELGLDVAVGDDIETSKTAPRVVEPLASRSVEDHVGVLGSIERARAAYERRYPAGITEIH